MAEHSDELSVLRQACVLLALTTVLLRDHAASVTGDSVRGDHPRRTLADATSALVAVDLALGDWLDRVEKAMKRVSAIASARTNPFATVKAQFITELYVPPRSARDDLEEAAAGSVTGWRWLRKSRPARTIAVLHAVRECVRPVAQALVADKQIASPAFWDVLDGKDTPMADWTAEVPRLLDAKSRWKALFAAFMDEAGQLPIEPMPAFEAVRLAITFGSVKALRLGDVQRLFGVSSDALKALLPDGWRKRGSMTVDDGRRALGLGRVRDLDPEPVKKTTLDGARIYVYPGPHPLLDIAPDRHVIGHADFDVAPSDRRAPGTHDEPAGLVPTRSVGLLAADVLGVTTVAVVAREVVVLNVLGQVAGVRVLLEFVAVN